MKKPEELHKELINENYIDMKPINTIDTRVKEPFWSKFENFLSEGESLQPLVNNEEKVNTKEEDEKIKIMKANTAWIINWLVHLKNLKL